MAKSRTSNRKPRELGSAAETKERLVQALLRLLSRASVAGLSVRQIAAEAGVNHGLVHRYFGSKDELVRQAVGRISARVHAEQEHSGGGTAASFAVMRRDPVLPLVVARACLDGPHDLLRLAAPPPQRLAAVIAPIRAALARLGLTAEADACLVNALGTAALLGWFVFRPLLAEGYGVPAGADDRIAELLGQLDRLLRAAATV